MSAAGVISKQFAHIDVRISSPRGERTAHVSKVNIVKEDDESFMNYCRIYLYMSTINNNIECDFVM